MNKSREVSINGYYLLTLVILIVASISLIAFGDRSKVSVVTFSATMLVLALAIGAPILKIICGTEKEQLFEITVYLLLWLAIVVIYENLTMMTAFVPMDLKDSMLMNLDQNFFGQTPALAIQEMGLYRPYLTQFFTFTYIAIYTLFPPLFGMYLLISKKKSELAKYVATFAVVGMLGYLIYLLVPGVGPEVYYASLFNDELYRNSGIDHILVQGLQGYPKNAFPSMHTAFIVLFMIFAYRDDKRIFLITLPLTISLLISTIYLRQHYFVDLIAGAALSLMIAALMTCKPVERMLDREISLSGKKQL